MLRRLLRHSRFTSWRTCLAALGAIVLAGCAAPALVPPDATAPARDTLDAFAIEGRFTLRQQQTSYSGRLSWRHAGDTAAGGEGDEILLASPFGQGIAQISASAAGAQLVTSDGKVYAASDSEQLTRDVLGYPLPLAQLADWLRGRGPGDFTRDAAGRPLRLLSADWRIDYEYDSDDAQALPARLFAQRADGAEFRLRIDEWSERPAVLPDAHP
jgi:outer membrane lipoprotein LolB